LDIFYWKFVLFGVSFSGKKFSVECPFKKKMSFVFFSKMRGGVEYSAPEVINCEALTTAAGRRQNRSKNILNFLFLN
jgi:hypothetical protein